MTFSVTANRQDAGECADALSDLVQSAEYNELTFRQRLLVSDLLDALRSAERGEVREKTHPAATHELGESGA